MKFLKNRTLLEKMLLVQLALAVCGLWAICYVHLSAAKVLTAAEDSFILVHLDEANAFSDANAFCASEYGTHLAVIEDSDANDKMHTALTQYSKPAWIGYADLDNSGDFQWLDLSSNAYVNWAPDEPTDLCVQMQAANGMWQDVDCSETKNAFFCEAPKDGFELVATSGKTFDEANDYCATEYGTELATISSDNDNDLMANWVSTTFGSGASVWIGLNDRDVEDTWKWVDGSADAYTKWAANEPSNSGGIEHCTLLYAGGEWNDGRCDYGPNGFVCNAPNMEATVIVRVDNAEVHKLPTAIGSGEAQAYCQSQGFDLYSVIDTEDNTRIQTALNAAGVDSAWIGLQTAAASYAWKDGRALDYVNWATADGEPKESHFSQMRASDGQWMTACADDKHVGVVCVA